MPALDDILALEQEISEVRKGLMSSGVAVSGTKRKLVDIRTKMDKAQETVMLATNAINSMKLEELVSLEEYINLQKLRDSAYRVLDTVRDELSTNISLMTAVDLKTKALNKRMEELELLSKEYGQVVDFPGVK